MIDGDVRLHESESAFHVILAQRSANNNQNEGTLMLQTGQTLTLLVKRYLDYDYYHNLPRLPNYVSLSLHLSPQF